MSSNILSVDLETPLIGPGAIAPHPICMTWARRRAGAVEGLIWGNGDPEFHDRVREAIEGAADGQHVLAGANVGGFDIPVIHHWYPALRPAIWRAFERDAISDVQTREKLMNLALIGQVDHYYTPDGEQRDILYNLAALAGRYLGKDRTREKGMGVDALKESGLLEFQDDVWRKHYDVLDGKRADEYPPEARTYALHDTEDVLLIRELQEGRAADLRAQGAQFPDGSPYDPFSQEGLHVAAKFCMYLMTIAGIPVDPSAVDRLKEAVARELVPQRFARAIVSGILIPPQPARRYANGARNQDGTFKVVPADVKWHTSKKLLQALVEHTVERVNEEAGDDKLVLKRTNPLDMTPANREKWPDGQVSTDSEVIDDLSPFDPTIEEYSHYSALGKLKDNEIPRLEEAVAQGCRMHPGFDDIKKTLRTSSRRSRSFASINIQQLARGFEIETPCPVKDKDCPYCNGKGVIKTKIEPRNAYVPEQGWVLCSVDYSMLEIVTAAQKAFQVVGQSVMRDKVNAGMDLHAAYAGVLCRATDPGFAARCEVELNGKARDDDAVYALFKKLAKGSPDEAAYYKLKRQFAKAPNLGLPGGMGHRMLMTYAKNNYNVLFESLEQAKQVKDHWMTTFPEFPEYFRWVKTKCVDSIHSREGRDEKGRDKKRYSYWSPLLVYRSNCFFTECANGQALQTPAAEGSKIAMFEVSRACYDPTLGSCLYGCVPHAWIHDEFLVSVPDDQFLHERCWEIVRIMVEAMKVICPDMVIKAEPCAQDYWQKGAEFICDRNGRLTVWRKHAYQEWNGVCSYCSLKQIHSLHQAA